MRTRLIRAGLTVIAAAGIVGASACSVSGAGGASGGASGKQPASVVLPAITAAVKSARSVHVTGKVSTGGRIVTVNLSFAGAGGMTGTMTVNGAKLRVLVVKNKTYIKINSGFLTLASVPRAACRLMCGKFVLVPAAAAQAITGALSMSSLLNDAFGKLPHAAAGQYFDPATYQGQSVLEFRQSGYSLIVASSSPHYPLAIGAPHGQYLGFSDWNAVPVPAPPPARETVKLGNLG